MTHAKTIMTFILLCIITTKIAHTLEITLNVTQDITDQETTPEKTIYRSPNQTLKKTTAWIILAIFAAICTMSLIKH